MKLNQFFTRLVAALFGTDNPAKANPLSPAEQTRAKRELMRKPEVLAEAQRAGNARRFASWQRSCEQAYEAKCRKGQRAGIPRWWLKQNGHA